MPHDSKCELLEFVRTWNEKIWKQELDDVNPITGEELQHMRTRQFGCYCKVREENPSFLVTFKMQTETGHEVLEWVRLFRLTGRTLLVSREQDSKVQQAYDEKPLAAVISVDFRARIRLPD